MSHASTMEVDPTPALHTLEWCVCTHIRFWHIKDKKTGRPICDSCPKDKPGREHEFVPR